jgi:hypothetical protein
MFATIYQTTRRHVLENDNHNIHHIENLTTHMFDVLLCSVEEQAPPYPNY